MHIDIIVDVDDFELVDPQAMSGNVDGQGHWHLVVNNDYQPSMWHSSTATYDKLSGTYQDGDVLRVEPSLQDNSHNFISDTATSVIELIVVDPDDSVCL